MKENNNNLPDTLIPQGQSISENEIILYQPDSTLTLDVRLENETVWLTQQQIADLFGVKQPAISKHLTNIFKTNELDENSVHSILEYTAASPTEYSPTQSRAGVPHAVGTRFCASAQVFR